MGAEAHLALVQREVGRAAAERKQLLARVAVPHILLDRVVHRLLGQAVLEFKSKDRQAVDEQPNIQRPLGFVAAVAQLAGDAEAVLLEAFLSLVVASRRRAVEQVQVVRPVLDAVAQHVDGAAFGNLALEPGQELAPRRAVLGQTQRVRRLGLGRAQKGAELDHIDAVLAVVIVGVAPAPAHPAVIRRWFGCGTGLGRLAGMAGQCGADQAFETVFGGVGGHFCYSAMTTKGENVALLRVISAGSNPTGRQAGVAFQKD